MWRGRERERERETATSGTVAFAEQLSLIIKSIPRGRSRRLPTRGFRTPDPEILGSWLAVLKEYICEADRVYFFAIPLLFACQIETIFF